MQWLLDGYEKFEQGGRRCFCRASDAGKHTPLGPSWEAPSPAKTTFTP